MVVYLVYSKNVHKQHLRGIYQKLSEARIRARGLLNTPEHDGYTHIVVKAAKMGDVAQEQFVTGYKRTVRQWDAVKSRFIMGDIQECPTE